MAKKNDPIVVVEGMEIDREALARGGQFVAIEGPTARERYEAYRERKQQSHSLPLPSFDQLDELERASWEAAGAL